MARDVNGMSEQELRDELQRIRLERSGVGRKRVRQAKTKRMDGVHKEKRRKNEAQAEANADWV